MPDILESVEEGVGVLTLNRPDRLNALSQQILSGLREGLARMAEDAAVGAIVITGAGRGFCAGGDVKDMANRTAQHFEERVARLSRMHELPQVMRRHPKVIIGMVNGPAFGAGLGLAMACDLRVAARSARFGTAFANIGYSGDFGGSWLLTQLVGPAKAREMYLLAEPIDAERAEAIGLVNRVVDDSALVAETMALARRLAAGPRLAYGYIKRNLFAAETEPFAAVLQLEGLHQARTGQTEDHREAVRAFAEKRKPVFRGA
ncbi:MAG: enoyl-CoA hydratase [Acetobacteraceae bacterium]|nr:enoyl-CoA hydratase [Acetobacteraceae bacterium]